MDGNRNAVRLLGKRGYTAAFAIDDFLHRCGVVCEWVELQSDEQARAEAKVDSLADERLPVCIFADGSRLERPTLRQVIEKLGWFRNPQHSEYDVSIYGAGPAGLSAAVYAASEGLRTVVIERSAVGGQAGSSPKIENYLGFPEGISGAALAERAWQQAVRFGAEILLLREGVGGEFPAGRRIGHLADGTRIVARACICATGRDYNRLGLPGEDRLEGAGIFYGAGASQAALCSREHVYVVGAGNSAGQAALHLCRFAACVTMVVREETLTSTVSAYLVDRLLSEPKIVIRYRTEVTALHGDNILDGITLRDRRTDEEKQVATHWLFLCLGGTPHTDWAPALGIERDEAGYLVTGADLLRDGRLPKNWTLNRAPYPLETNIPGVFAVGDVRHGSVKRFASAVGEGAMAVISIHEYLAKG